jgi:serine protease DegQ
VRGWNIALPILSEHHARNLAVNRMNTFYRFGLFVVRFAILGLAAAFVISIVSPQFADRVRNLVAPAAAPIAMTDPGTKPVSVARSAPDHVPAEQEGPTDGITVSYSSAVSRAAPAVVNIYANKVVSTRQLLVPSNPVLQRYFPGVQVGPTMKQHQQSLGSGVIVSADGYVVTNNHVIQGAEEIQVVLDDGRVTQARVIGADVETDLAVLKIDTENLPSIVVADRTPLNVGDVVLAIGNPVNRGKTVTMGIVSALGRQLSMSIYEDFIQTDAAINEGNSGGALVNAHGELIGINTAFAQSAEGVGFAIPVRTAKAVLDQIVAHGRVIRGWLGAEYADIASIQNPTSKHGVAVIGIYDKGPAALAGLRPGDVLLALDDEPITSQLELRNREATLTPGTKVGISGQRNGTAFKLEATLQERPQRQNSG